MSKTIDRIARGDEEIFLQKKHIQGLVSDLSMLENMADSLQIALNSLQSDLNTLKLQITNLEVTGSTDITISVATTTSDGLMSAADKVKLNGIASGAQVNSTATATSSSNGLMSASDKSKLDGIATGAQVNTVTGVKGNSESSYRTGNINLTAANLGISTASSSSNGLMSSSDKSKLDGIESGAQKNVSYSVATSSSNGLMSSSDKSKLDGISFDSTYPFLNTYNGRYSGINLNTFTKSGIFWCYKNCTNLPNTNQDFLVINLIYSSYMVQVALPILTTSSSSKISVFLRYFNGSSWTAWHYNLSAE